MPNGDIALDEFEPSFTMEQFPSSGFPPAQAPFFENDSQWNLRSWTSEEPDDDYIPAPNIGCLTDAGPPPGSGTYVLGSVDGTCQWIDTTTCA